MRMNSLEARCAGLLLLAACAWGADGAAQAGTPCAGPERLCASVDANTRVPARAAALGDASDVAVETLHIVVTDTAADPSSHAGVPGKPLHIAFTRTAGMPLAAAFTAIAAGAGDPAIQPKPARPAGADPAQTAASADPSAPQSIPGAAAAAARAAPPDTVPASASGGTAATARPAPPDTLPAGASGAAAAAGASPGAGATARGGASPTAPIRIALLLPGRSATLATAAEAVRAGFMAGMERDGSGFTADVVSTGDAPRDVLDAYARAAAANDIVVGPLARSAVAALVESGAVGKPTVVLSVPEGRPAVPRGVLVVGLSVEDEARQIAEWAAREHPHGRALILTGGAAWAQRAAGAFEARWAQLGHTNQRFAVPSGEAGTAALDELKQKLEIDPPDLLFAALDGTQLRVVRATAGATIPCYGGGAAHPGRTPDPGATPLDGVRLLDVPWLVRPDHPAVMVYPRPLNTDQPLDMDRLYALGIDAFRIARELALRGGAPFGLDGVTGRLDVSAGSGGQLTLQRREAAVVVRNGVFEPVDKDR